MIIISFLRVSFILGLMLGSFSINGQGVPDVTERKRLHVKKINNTETILELNSLPVCSRYGCLEITNVSLTTEQWESIGSIFKIPPVSAAKERELLSVAIGQIEVIVGAKNNTHSDVGGTFNVYLNPSQGKSEQMDCIDESANTLLYLRLLQQEHKIYWHDVYGLSSRGGLKAGYPHTAVLIVDNTTKQKYIIDSWFHGNGEPAEVIPYKVWKKGWKPRKKY
jgi:hypothetical protein